MNEVLIDNQANNSVVHTSLLRDVQPADQTVKINGVGGHQFSVSETGYLDPLFRVYASEVTRVNILSLSEVEDQYLVRYEPQKNFIIHLLETDIVFNRKVGMYVADWYLYKAIFKTTTNAIYTKAQEMKAKQADELLRTSGFPSIAEAINLLQDGNITNIPDITIEDLNRAYDIFGMPTEYVRGKMMNRKVRRGAVERELIMEEKTQTLASDVMHTDGKTFLITTSDPLKLTQQCYLTSESANQLGLGLQGHINNLRSRGFKPTFVYTDPGSGFCALTTAFPGTLINISGAEDYVATVDAKIGRIKEVYVSIESRLPWKLPSALVKDLVAYAAARLNIFMMTALTQNVCPKVLFTGLKINYKKELELAFGDYCGVYDRS